jgi:hypothetical protein
MSATTLAKYASAVVSPRELGAPLLDLVQKRLAKPAKGQFKKDDLKQVKKLISDFLGWAIGLVNGLPNGWKSAEPVSNEWFQNEFNDWDWDLGGACSHSTIVGYRL